MDYGSSRGKELAAAMASKQILTVRRISLCKTVRDVSLILQQLQLLKIVERDGCGKNRHVQPYHGSAVGGPVLKSKL